MEEQYKLALIQNSANYFGGFELETVPTRFVWKINQRILDSLNLTSIFLGIHSDSVEILFFLGIISKLLIHNFL